MHVTVTNADNSESVTIDATPGHPFYVVGYGFKYASELKIGDKLRSVSGDIYEVTDTEVEHFGIPIKVYNFEVEDWHTYAVSEVGVVVHNSCKNTSNNTQKTSKEKTKGETSKPKGWKVGDPIDNLTKAGNEPSWSTVRSRYWKNEAFYNASEYCESDLILMRKGRAPRHPEIDVPKEIHHINGREIENPHNIENLEDLWPWDHDIKDKYRHYTGPRPEGVSNE